MRVLCLLFLGLATVWAQQYDCESDPITNALNDASLKCGIGAEESAESGEKNGFFGFFRRKRKSVAYQDYPSICIVNQMGYIRSGFLARPVSARWSDIKSTLSSKGLASVWETCTGQHLEQDEDGILQLVKRMFLTGRSKVALEEQLEEFLLCVTEETSKLCTDQDETTTMPPMTTTPMPTTTPHMHTTTHMPTTSATPVHNTTVPMPTTTPHMDTTTPHMPTTTPPMDTTTTHMDTTTPSSGNTTIVPMPTTTVVVRSKKFEAFVANENLDGIPVEKLPQIGSVYGGRLREHGIRDASQLVKELHRSNMDEDNFKAWLHPITNGNDYQLTETYEALMTWCENSPSECDAIAPSIKKTVIIIYKETIVGQDLVLRGKRAGPCDTPPFTVPIRLNELNEDKEKFWPEYSVWRLEDNFLSMETFPEQSGLYEGVPAYGSPMRWTTNDPNSDMYSEYNTFYPHHWVVEMDMDCSETMDGWFDVQAGLVNREDNSVEWEGEVMQGECEGGVVAPYADGMHAARCGSVNKFAFNGDYCLIYNK